MAVYVNRRGKGQSSGLLSRRATAVGEFSGQQHNPPRTSDPQRPRVWRVLLGDGEDRPDDHVDAHRDPPEPPGGVERDPGRAASFLANRSRRQWWSADRLLASPGERTLRPCQRQVGYKTIEFLVRAGRKGRVQPVDQLVLGEPALGVGVAQDSRDAVAVIVGRAHLRRLSHAFQYCSPIPNLAIGDFPELALSFDAGPPVGRGHVINR